MIRTTVYLLEVLHKAIKHLAVERGTSLAKLVTEALEALYKQDIDDLGVGRERLKAYLKHPDKTVFYADYQTKRSKR